MNIVFDVPKNDAALWIQALQNYLPMAAISYYSDGSMESADYYICENPPADHFNNPYHIKAVFLLSAGFDYYSKLISIKPCQLLTEIPCYRLEDAGMSEQMMDYATYSTLKFFRRFNEYDSNMTWNPLTTFSKADFKVGIMGTGELGAKVALRLNSLGFSINTWNRSEKNLANVTQFIGENELENFINNTHVLINLLPLNNQTKGILNKTVFEKLAKPSYIINLARGAHVVEADLIEALDSGILSGAQLDVTVTEPLPDNSPLFTQQNCFITPHISAKTLIKESCEQISKKIKRLELNKKITGIIHWEE